MAASIPLVKLVTQTVGSAITGFARVASHPVGGMVVGAVAVDAAQKAGLVDDLGTILGGAYKWIAGLGSTATSEAPAAADATPAASAEVAVSGHAHGHDCGCDKNPHEEEHCDECKMKDEINAFFVGLATEHSLPTPPALGPEYGKQLVLYIAGTLDDLKALGKIPPKPWTGKNKAPNFNSDAYWAGGFEGFDESKYLMALTQWIKQELSRAETMLNDVKADAKAAQKDADKKLAAAKEDVKAAKDETKLVKGQVEKLEKQLKIVTTFRDQHKGNVDHLNAKIATLTALADKAKEYEAKIDDLSAKLQGSISSGDKALLEQKIATLEKELAAAQQLAVKAETASAADLEKMLAAVAKTKAVKELFPEQAAPPPAYPQQGYGAPWGAAPMAEQAPPVGYPQQSWGADLYNGFDDPFAPTVDQETGLPMDPFLGMPIMGAGSEPFTEVAPVGTDYGYGGEPVSDLWEHLGVNEDFVAVSGVTEAAGAVCTPCMAFN